MTKKIIKFPRDVKIGHILYSINLKDQENVIDGDGNKCWGTCDYDKMEIDISKATSFPHVKMTLLHEIFHAIDWAAGNTMAESQIHSAAIGIYGVLKDNPDVFEYLFEGNSKNEASNAE